MSYELTPENVAIEYTISSPTRAPFLQAEIEELLKQAKAEARIEALREAKERLEAIADTYSMQADRIQNTSINEGSAAYYTYLDKANALREAASAVEGLK